MSKIIVVLMLTIFLLDFSAYSQVVKNAEAEIDSLNELALKERTRKRTVAFSLAKRAFQLSEVNGYAKGEHEARLNLAILHTLGSQYDSGLYFLRSIDDNKVDDIKGAIKDFYRGRIYSALRDFKNAERFYRAAQIVFDQHTTQLLSKIELHDFVGSVPNSLGTMKLLQQDDNEAIKLFLQALEIRTKHNLPVNKELHNIALVYNRKRNSRKALEFLNRAFSIGYKIADTAAILLTANAIGNCYNSMKYYDSAALFYDSALTLAKQMKRPDLAANALVNKAELFYDQKDYKNAIKALHETISLASAFRNYGALSHAYQQLGDVLRKVGNNDSSIFYAKKALELSLRNKNRAVIKKSAGALADTYEQINRLDSAYKYARLFHHYDEEMDSLGHASQFADLRVRIETLEKDQEIASLQSQQEVDRLKNQRLILGLVSLALLGSFFVGTLYVRGKAQKRINEIEQAKLKAELSIDRENLYKQTLSMIHVNNCLDEVQEQVKEMMSSHSDVRLGRVVNLIKANKTLQSDWENFNKYFGNVHTSFYQKLNEVNAQLTTHEKRVCALIKVSLSNREIAILLNIEPKSVVMIKYRIKKKLGLGESEDLETYLAQLN